MELALNDAYLAKYSLYHQDYIPILVNPEQVEVNFWYLPLPHHPVYNCIRQTVCQLLVEIRGLDICQRVCKCFCGCPRHSEHDVDRNPQGFRAVNVGKTWWIRNDCVGHERVAGTLVWLNARIPAPFHHFFHHCSFFLDLPGAQSTHAW